MGALRVSDRNVGAAFTEEGRRLQARERPVSRLVAGEGAQRARRAAVSVRRRLQERGPLRAGPWVARWWADSIRPV